ncbi:MAG: SDR family oxidoreductase [Hoeflea sp.]|uniref:SDR family NAD(P)-dependent oxidoreductase n=1 Tax=Hoeflea sp. TaxID=1940281 RepID=UPI0027303604|nr:SDR family oxidoreductase [Hoeflea sp.]MDP2120524.1 SDR family oxidoreductase [Hoeflea sp.]
MRAAELFDVSGEVALITGGGTGIGLAIARVLAVNGAKVAIAGKDHGALEAAVGLLTDLGGEAIAIPIDVRQDEMIPSSFDSVETTWGPVTVLVNNAGVVHRDKAVHLTRETIRDVMAVNVDGAVMMAQEAARRMIRDGRGGSIINISSILAGVPMRQVAAYSASKAALSQMTRSLALEWAKHGIRVNEIRPGWFETTLTDRFLKGPGAHVMAGQNPLGRLGAPHDLDGAILLLASKAGIYMTGSAITVDGGHSLGR